MNPEPDQPADRAPERRPPPDDACWRCLDSDPADMAISAAESWWSDGCCWQD